jgi:DNA-binding beta-propeller fold protein YncE
MIRGSMRPPVRAALVAALLTLSGGIAAGQGSPTPYRLLATAESDDQVALIEFRPCPGEGCGARLVRTYAVGLWSAETEGPHGVIPDAEGRTFFVSLAHGRPNGFLQRVELESGRILGTVALGMFPATVDRGAGDIIYSINFNFEDPEMGVSSLSVVDGVSMQELARVPTCRMPHGSRLSPDGSRHYSGCMMDDLLVEIDTRTLEVSRLFGLKSGAEGPVAVAGRQEHAAMSHDMGPAPVSNSCSPTWAQPSADGKSVFVACNRSAEIAEVDVAGWTLTRRWSTPKAPYNLAVTPDGKLLVATQKGPGTVSIWRIADATLLAEVKGTRGVASGVVVSPDSRYAFATMEGVGGEPGTVDVIDLSSLARVASVDMGKQAGGIALLP